MQISTNSVVTLTYTLRQNNAAGEIIEQVDAQYPFKFLFGAGNLLPAFEKHLDSLTETDTFEFTLSPEEGYGAKREDQIVDVPISVFVKDGVVQQELLAVGKYIALTDNQGQTHNGIIVAFNDQQVRIDFNHAMAGKTLHFQGVILKIRAATPEELVRKHPIDDDGVHLS